MKTLDDCRIAIDEIDNQILKLLNSRMEVVEEVGKIKRDTGGAIYRPERERDIIQRLAKQNDESDGLLKDRKSVV